MYAEQVNGKMRGTVDVDKETSQAEAQAAAMEVTNIAKYVDGKAMKKVIWVPGKVLNIIVAK